MKNKPFAKRIFAAILAVSFLGCSAVSVSAYDSKPIEPISAAEPVATSGKCGDNVTYTLDSEGTLTISGSGDMEGYSWSSSPFYENCDIKNIIIENGVTSIGRNAFEDCSSLTSITIPNSVTSIGEDAFYGTVWYDSQPDGLVYAGKVAYEYKGVMPDNTSIKIKDGTVGIGDCAFLGCSSLMSITIPNSVTFIGEYAFEGCSSLTSITIPNSVTSIGRYAFCSCSSLTSITIPDSVTSIGRYAFCSCSSLTSITIPDSVTSIGDSAFSGCSSLTSITIPDSVTSIGGYAFYGCSSDLTIYGYRDSDAETYANENGISFEMINDIKDDDTQVTVSGAIGDNVILKVSELSVDEIELDEENREVKAYFDISLIKDGEKVQPGMPVTVKIPYSGAASNIEVYRLNEDGTMDKMNCTYDGSYITFVTDHFSKYIIVADSGILGDTNGDGVADIADSLMISRYDAGLITLDDAQVTVSDVNGDGNADIADALKIARFDAGLIESLL